MARFDVDFAHVRYSGDITKVLAGYNVALVGDGDQRKANCPLHEDTRSSLSVNTEKGVFKCHSCGAAGNVIKLVQLIDPECENPRKAALRVAELSGIAAKPGSAPKAQQRLKCASTTEEANVAEKTAPEAENEPLSSDEDGIRFNRPLTFSLQLTPVSPEDDSPASTFVKKLGTTSERLAELGIGMSTRGSMKDRLAIPIWNRDVELVAYCGRDVGLLEDGAEKYKYPPKFHRELELYGWESAQHFSHVVVVESFLGVIKFGRSFAELGDDSLGIVALMNNRISDAQVELLSETRPHITICMNGDEGGQQASVEIAGRLARAGMWVATRGAPGWKPHHDTSEQLYNRIRA